MSKYAPSSNKKKKVEWDLKRILSTVFVATISALLVVFFIAGDIGSSCGGGESKGGRPLLAKFSGGRIYLGDEELGNRISRMQEEYRGAEQKDLAKAALSQMVQERVFGAAARSYGLPLSEETRRAILYRYLDSVKVSPAQFASANRSYRKSVEDSINSDHQRRALQADIMASARSTRLWLRIDNEVQSMKTAIDVVALDLKTLLENKAPTNDELRTWFKGQKGIRGEESWRRATSFEALTPEARTSLIDSWKKANSTLILMGAIKEMGDQLKIVEDALKDGKSLEAAAASAALPLANSDFFAFGENPTAGGREIPVNREFFSQLAGVATGAVSPLVKITGNDGMPQAMLIFRVRDRRTIPDYNPSLVSDKASWDTLPKAEQDRIRNLMRAQLERIEKQTKYALFNDFFSSLYAKANVVLNTAELDKL
jgi:hypothetical protein